MQSLLTRGSNAKYSSAGSGTHRHLQQQQQLHHQRQQHHLRHPSQSHQQQRTNWNNRVQFDETFVWDPPFVVEDFRHLVNHLLFLCADFHQRAAQKSASSLCLFFRDDYFSITRIERWESWFSKKKNEKLSLLWLALSLSIFSLQCPRDLGLNTCSDSSQRDVCDWLVMNIFFYRTNFWWPQPKNKQRKK